MVWLLFTEATNKYIYIKASIVFFFSPRLVDNVKYNKTALFCGLNQASGSSYIGVIPPTWWYLEMGCLGDIRFRRGNSEIIKIWQRVCSSPAVWGPSKKAGSCLCALKRVLLWTCQVLTPQKLRNQLLLFQCLISQVWQRHTPCDIMSQTPGLWHKSCYTSGRPYYYCFFLYLIPQNMNTLKVSNFIGFFWVDFFKT